MQKDASILFSVSFVAFIVFALLLSNTINTMMGSLSDISSIFTILQNIGITGYFYGTMVLACFILAIIFAIKAFR